MPLLETHTIALGTLAPGSYSVIVTFHDEEVVCNPTPSLTMPPFPLQVAEAHVIPALDRRAMFLLAAAIAALGLLALRRL